MSSDNSRGYPIVQALVRGMVVPARARLERFPSSRNRILIPDSGACLILMSVFEAKDVRFRSLLPARGPTGCARQGAAARGDG